MTMQKYEVSCGADLQPDGTYTLAITVTSLTLEQATEIGQAAEKPMSEIIHQTLTKGGALKHRTTRT